MCGRTDVSLYISRQTERLVLWRRFDCRSVLDEFRLSWVLLLISFYHHIPCLGGLAMRPCLLRQTMAGNTFCQAEMKAFLWIRCCKRWWLVFLRTPSECLVHDETKSWPPQSDACLLAICTIFRHFCIFAASCDSLQTCFSSCWAYSAVIYCIATLSLVQDVSFLHQNWVAIQVEMSTETGNGMKNYVAPFPTCMLGTATKFCNADSLIYCFAV